MNCADFYDAMCDNEVINAKRSAYLDHMYEQERARLSSNHTVTYNNPKPSTNQSNIDDIVNRISKLEDKVNRLYDMMAECKEKSKPTLFNTITSKDACIVSNSNICLTDEQFEKFMNELK